jgi:hypothetical protein
MLAALWLANPIDLIMEFVPIVGPLDDVVVVALALRYATRQVSRLGPPGHLARRNAAAGAAPRPSPRVTGSSDLPQSGKGDNFHFRPDEGVSHRRSSSCSASWSLPASWSPTPPRSWRRSAASRSAPCCGAPGEGWHGWRSPPPESGLSNGGPPVVHVGPAITQTICLTRSSRRNPQGKPLSMRLTRQALQLRVIEDHVEAGQVVLELTPPELAGRIPTCCRWAASRPTRTCTGTSHPCPRHAIRATAVPRSHAREWRHPLVSHASR